MSNMNDNQKSPSSQFHLAHACQQKLRGFYGGKPLRGPVHQKKKGTNRSSQIKKTLPSLLFFIFAFQAQRRYQCSLQYYFQLNVDVNPQHRFAPQLTLVLSSFSPSPSYSFFLFSLYFLHLPTPFLTQSTIANTSSSLSTPIYHAEQSTHYRPSNSSKT